MIVLRLTESTKAAKGEPEQGSRGDQQGHRAVVAFHPKGFRCACGKVDHLQDARSQGCEDDAAVCESDPKESASFVSLVTTLFSFICTSPRNSTIKQYNQ